MDKVKLTKHHCDLLRELRKKTGMSAESVSYILKLSPAWFGRVERGNYKTIKKDKLKEVLKILYEEKSEDHVQRFLEEAAQLEAQALKEEYELAWFSQKTYQKKFSDINTEDYSQLNLAEEFSKELSLFENEMHRQFDTARSNLERFILLRMIRTQKLNAMTAPEANIVINSSPIYHAYTKSKLEQSKVTETVLSFFEKYDKVVKADSVRDPARHLELLQHISSLIQDATTQLNTMRTARPVTEEMFATLNKQLTGINVLCRINSLVYDQLPMFYFDNGNARKLISSCKKILADLECRIDSDITELEEYFVMRTQEIQEDPDYYNALYEGMSSEQFENLDSKEDTQLQDQEDTEEYDNDNKEP